MGLFSDKIGLVMGVANDHSIAWAMSQSLYAEGAELAFTHLPTPSNERRLKRLVEPYAPKIAMPCDVQSDADVARVFEAVRDTYGKLDFLIHSIAFAPPQELRKPYVETSRAGWAPGDGHQRLQPVGRVPRSVAAYVGGERRSSTLSYFGGEKVMPATT